MKKLENFDCKKVKINSIYGGSGASKTFDQDTITVGGSQSNDGSDEHWDN